MTPLVWLALALGIAAGIAALLSMPRRKPKRAAKVRQRSPAPLPAQPANVPSAPAPVAEIPRLTSDDDDEEDEIITRITFAPGEEPTIDGEDDETTRVRIEQRAIPILFDEDAALDEPTGVSPLILVSAAGGRPTRGAAAAATRTASWCSRTTASTSSPTAWAGTPAASREQDGRRWIGEAFEKTAFIGKPYRTSPAAAASWRSPSRWRTRPSSSTRASHRDTQGMGTTVVAARFSPNKQRVYVGHVGDSRCYRLRNGQLRQMTTDHTMVGGRRGPLRRAPEPRGRRPGRR